MRWARKLEAALQKPPKGVTFSVGRRASASDVAELEEGLGTRLPKDDRTFLQHFGALEVRAGGRLNCVVFGVARRKALRVLDQTLSFRRSAELHDDFATVVVLGASREDFAIEHLEDYVFLIARKVQWARSNDLAASSREVAPALRDATSFGTWVNELLDELSCRIDPAPKKVATAARVPGPRQAMSMSDQTARVLRTLTPREESILRKRFGIEKAKDQVGRGNEPDFHVPQSRIDEIEAMAMAKLAKLRERGDGS